MINELRDRLSAEDRAVSPVIGVILMVAITVILAAVIGSFVLGIGSNINETPQVRLEVSDADETLDSSENDIFVIQHNGGAELTDENLQLRVADDTGSTLAVYNGDTDDPVNGGGVEYS